jgi:serine/threonine protein kinase
MLNEGQVIGGRFLVNRLIAQGGYASVYQAHDLETGQAVALKELRSEVALSDPEIIARFQRESDALKRLDHPAIIKIYHDFNENDHHYVVMEYVSGGDLAGMIADYQANGQFIPIDDVIHLGIHLAEALKYAHELHVIHRDIKPANILLASDKTPRLSDFGVARLTDAQRLTRSGIMVGTLGYLSPESVSGESIDQRADIWSFGILLYELLTLQRPFDSPNIARVLASILTQQPTPIQDLRPDVPAMMIELVDEMLVKDVDERLNDVSIVYKKLNHLKT